MPENSATARRWLSRALAIAAAALSLGVAGCGTDDDPDRATGTGVTLSASTDEELVYLSLGDSLARGVQPDRAANLKRGYPRRLRDRLEKRSGKSVTLIEAGCPGVTTEGFMEGNETCPPEAPIPYENVGRSTSQLAFAEAQLRARGDRPTLVTLSIGGNDVIDCVDVDARSVQLCLASAADEFNRRLDEIARRLADAAGGRTVLAVSTIYDPALGALRLGRAPVELVAAFHDGIAKGVNPAIRGTFGKAGWVIADLGPSFDEDAPILDARSRAVDRICRFTWACSDKADIHLNDSGYALSARIHDRMLRRPLYAAWAQSEGRAAAIEATKNP